MGGTSYKIYSQTRFPEDSRCTIWLDVKNFSLLLNLVNILK
jgi:hypothetical protein